MIRLAICDDDKRFLKEAAEFVRAYFEARGKEYSLALANDAQSFAESFQADVFDIVILDIVMPVRTGIEVSKIIFERDRNCLIAFVTSSPDFAIQGYGVNAVSYLLKPLTGEKIAALLDECLQRRDKSRSRSIIVKCSRQNRKVNLDRTIYLESRNKQVLIHCDDETISSMGKLGDYLLCLPDTFIQIHKSYVVNLARVKSMSRNEMISDNDSHIPISRPFQKEAARRYFEYVAGQI